MDKYCKHERISDSCKAEYYLFTWFIPKVSPIENLSVDTVDFKMQNGHSYYAILDVSKEKIEFRIVSTTASLKCSVSMFMRSETLLSDNLMVTNKTSSSVYETTLFSENEYFQKLGQYPNDTLVLICRIKYPTNRHSTSSVTVSNTAMDTWRNLKILASGLKNAHECLLNEKVILQVGEETETASKAVLCARSPVFAKMFQNDMKELKDNVVAVTDIKMPVLKALITFLYAGKLSDYDFDFLCELYYASDKYDIADLRQVCIDLLSPRISMKNIIPTLKLAFFHNDMQLKSSAMTMIAANIETWVLTNEWKNFINDEPKIAVEVLSFFDF